MAKVKNKFGEPRIVPSLERRVEKDQVVEVPDDELFGFTVQEGWEPVGDDSQALHDAGAAAQVCAQLTQDAEAGAPIVEPDVEAPRDAWAGYALATEQATPDELEGKDRDDLVAQYATPEPDPEAEEPAKNATTEEWATYVVDAGLASEEEVAGKSRAELIDTYATKES